MELSTQDGKRNISSTLHTLWYRIVNKKIEIDPERAVIICKVFQWYLDGISKEQIAHKLNKAGVLSNQNKAWRAGGIHYILTNERYIGDSLWQKTYTTETIPTVRHRNTGAREQYYVEGTHPPIISKEVFIKVQTLIQIRKENYGKSPSETIHLLKKGYLWVLRDSAAKETAKR
mgnify:CR=1 FL=1